jgi:hypothetical protein
MISIANLKIPEHGRFRSHENDRKDVPNPSEIWVQNEPRIKLEKSVFPDLSQINLFLPGFIQEIIFGKVYGRFFPGRVRDRVLLCQKLVKTSGFVPIISIPLIKIYPPPKGNLDHFCIFADFREIMGRTHVLKVSINNYWSHGTLFWEEDRSQK